jgi:RNA polymerase sigma-70 factor (ECF subfamily)
VTTGSDPALGAVISERRQLINLAYRLLGSLADAEDAVQEAYTRWYGMSETQRAAIEVPGAWLSKVTSRLCLDLLGSARARRERYVGEWVPEPLPEPAEWGSGRADAGTVDPADRITLDESISMAFLVVLEAMTPAERVAFVLHDVFRFPFADIADITGRTEGACRQLAFTARRRVVAARTDAVPATRQASIVKAFKEAWEAKDIEALLGLLDPQAVMIGDGGGLAATALHPIEGAEAIARTYLDLAEHAAGVTFLERTVNGQPGLVAVHHGAVSTVFAFDIVADKISRIWAIRNPEKLRPWIEAQDTP